MLTSNISYLENTLISKGILFFWVSDHYYYTIGL